MATPATTHNRARKAERGAAVVVVLVLTVLFFVAYALLSRPAPSHAPHVADLAYPKAVRYAETGLAWTKSRIYAAGREGLPILLEGPNGRGPADDHLVGLRHLRLTRTAQFSADNEETNSAIAIRDFGDGTKKWEVVRMVDGPSTRALVYVRIDNDFGDSLVDQATGLPLADHEGTIIATAVAEYPVHVDGNGVELASIHGSRARSRCKLRATFQVSDCAAPTFPSPTNRCGATLSWQEIP